MKRRQFIKRSAPAALLPGIFGGYSAKAFGADSMLMQALALPQTETDHVLVLVQLTGGNDGLNTVIPLADYSNYFNARTNIAISESKVLRLNGNSATGLHPAMTGMQQLYNNGKLAIVQSVGYPTPNFSHFRATDIWMSASDSNTVVNSGWAGRYLDQVYPGYPTGYPSSTAPDPLAIQIGSVTSLTFQGPGASMGMSISDPNSFYNLINGVQDPAPATPMGKELTYIRTVAQQTNQYTQRIKDAAAKVTQQATYPTNNSLADQLKIVARLIKGGLKTKMYLVSYGSFDTHSLQAVSADTTTGVHATLLKNVSDAIKTFTDDLQTLGVGDRVVGMTFSEFGRRIKSNASGGTDHGAAAPLFLFGNKVAAGITGNNAAIPTTASVNDNIPFQYDFRSVYASVLQSWFCVSSTALQMTLLKNFQSLPLINASGCVATNLPGTPAGVDVSLSAYPNPFVDTTTIKYHSRGAHTVLQVMDGSGRVVATPVDKTITAPGTFTHRFHAAPLPAGLYYIRLQNGVHQEVICVLKVRG